ncbi:MAG: GspE/PulE family protein [Sedimentisphaerales bacterium]|nr:GspE/PulE family protein [Sedimentisphaerales bacterium]
MQISALIKFLSALPRPELSPLQAVTLPFNPVKLILLIGWVYLCLYLVQRVQFGLLVPRNYKAIANLATLIAGPVVLGGLIVIDSVRKSAASGRTFAETLKTQIKMLIETMRAVHFARAKEGSAIMLLDSSGRNIHEIYSHGKSESHDSKILNLTKRVIFDALSDEASDILIDPKDISTYTVRFRVDGVLRIVDEVKADTCQAVINSIKAVSGMDISERRRPQDGAFTAKTADGTASFRVASAGVVSGEKLSVRILNRKAGTYTLTNVGFSQKQQKIIAEAISKPSGMLLLCGPTGSGKTTTLYATLNEIDFFTRNVITVEDPIECVLPNCSQIEINPKADITFANSLRSILRQDPDVICVGEIRDEETASIALRASQTGHLVLATVHSNSNASAIVRLMDLGISTLLISSGVTLILSQRLLRKLCDKCKVRAQLTPSQISEFHKQKVNYTNIYQAKGCDACYGTGYRGRTAICDIWIFDDKQKDAVAHNESLITEMRKDGDKRGRSSLQKEGLKKVVDGITSLEELKRVVG